MTLLRKLLFAALTAVALAAPLAAVSPARADPPGVTDELHYYVLYIRANPNEPWEVFDTYEYYADAKYDADNAQALGYQTFIQRQ